MKKVFLIGLLLFAVQLVGLSQEKLSELEQKMEFVVEISGAYPDSALTVLADIEQDVLESNNYPLIADLYHRRANCYFFKSKFETAIELYNKALKIRQSTGISQTDSVNLSEIGVLYNNISLSNEYLLNYPLAIEYAKKQEFIYSELKDYQMLAFRCYNHVAKLYYYLGDFENAMCYSFKEIETSTMANDSINLAYAFDFQSVLNQDLGLLDEAIDFQMESLKIRQELGDSLMISFSYNNIGASLLLKEEFEEALVYFQKSLNIKLKNNYAGVAGTYNNLGLAYQKLGYLEKSEMFYSKSYKYSLEKEDPFGIAIAAVNLGVVYHLLNIPNKAEKYFVEAYNIGIDNGFKKTVVDATEYAHVFYADQNRYQEAYYMLLQNQIYQDSLQNDDVIKKITRLEAEHEYHQMQIADSILYQQQKIRDEEMHVEAIKRKEQLIWILGVTFVFIIIIIFGLFKAYQLRKKSQEDKLKQKALEIEKNLLRSQMNPHFIFNAMNSIQSFIAENDSYSALKYLSKFAKLIRLILENSMHKSIPLCDEVLSLELYLELEKVRFDNKFDFEIKIDDQIEEELVSVPPMLIQPFVENAIIHGIMHKKSKGCIKVNITEFENVLKCEIIDNGIGRDAALKHKEKQGIKHKSVGMQLTRERLEFLNQQTQPSMSYTVDDVINENNQVEGTKVVIYIPYL